MSMKDADQDRGQLLSIFSAEVWLHVLGNVKNAKDFQRISSASPYLGTLVRPLATQALFPEVLQIMNLRQPHWFTARELLPCRLVCHVWKSGVERALHDPEHLLLSKGEQEESQDLMNLWPHFAANIRTYERFGRVEQFARFQQHFGATHHQAGARSNPFFCHIIDLNLPRGALRFPPYFNACLEFLQTYGDYVRCCSIDMNFKNDEQRVQFYSTGLKQFLALMPHLRVCHVTDYPAMSKRLLERVDSALGSSAIPMPELKHLQKISVDGLPLLFMKALVQKNPHVSIASDTCGEKERVQVYLEEMPNLTRLEVQVTKESAFEGFENAEIVNCQLSTLHLVIPRSGDNLLAKIGLQRVFSMLETRFSVTLTELRLAGEFRAIQVTGLTPRLPNLKKFGFIMRTPIIPLDFLLALENTLEELTVGAYGYRRCHIAPAGGGLYRDSPSAPFRIKEAKRQDRTIKLYQFWVELQKSNAWVLFPKLKLLRTEGYGRPCLCTRDDWIAVQPQ